MRSFHSRQISVPLKNRVHSFRAQIDEHHPVDRGTSYTVVPRGVADLLRSISLRRTHTVIHAIGASHTASKNDFDEVFQGCVRYGTGILGTGMYGCRTELTEVSGTCIGGVPNLPKCPAPVRKYAPVPPVPVLMSNRTYRSFRYRY